MNDQELIYLMALACQTRISISQQQQLLQTMGSATEIFANRRDIARSIDNLSPRAADALSDLDTALPRCESTPKATTSASSD